MSASDAPIGFLGYQYAVLGKHADDVYDKFPSRGRFRRKLIRCSHSRATGRFTKNNETSTEIFDLTGRKISKSF